MLRIPHPHSHNASEHRGIGAHHCAQSDAINTVLWALSIWVEVFDVVRNFLPISPSLTSRFFVAANAATFGPDE